VPFFLPMCTCLLCRHPTIRLHSPRRRLPRTICRRRTNQVLRATTTTTMETRNMTRSTSGRRRDNDDLLQRRMRQHQIGLVRPNDGAKALQ
jgi:hypothetical protein